MSGLPDNLSIESDQVAVLSSELPTGPNFKAVAGFTRVGSGL